MILIRKYTSQKYSNNNTKIDKFNGIYRISSTSSKQYFTIRNNHLLLSDQPISYFRLIYIKYNLYYIELRNNFRKLGVDNINNILIYDKKGNYYNEKLIWNIIKINSYEYLIQNKFNKKFIEINNNIIICKNSYSYNFNTTDFKQIMKKFIFNILKLFDEGIFKSQFLKYINNEPIDLIIKYIDLTDKQLNRIGIKQIYKDIDNQELKYSIRSILEYIPWIRNIYILMPNKKVNFLKPTDYLKDKILYINDKEFLGYDSANIFAFTFNLYKLEKFGISKNFIYMEDDFFIGKPLKKFDFFYYDEKQRKVLPYILTWHFHEMDEYDILNKYEKLYKIKDSIHPHSREAWYFSTYSTEIFFIDNFKNNIDDRKKGILINNHIDSKRVSMQTFISTNFTHNAYSENIDDLKEIFEVIQNYKYINETLYSKERNILTLNKPHFYNLFQLNIKHKKVHSIPYKYIEMEKINKLQLNTALFVINTGGNHIPSKRHYKLQKKIMDKRFPFQSKYEFKTNIEIKYNILNVKKLFFILKLYLIFNIIKILKIYI